MSNFPPLRMAVLSALTELKDRVLADPTFFDSGSLPYDAETIAALKKIMAPQVVTRTIEKEGPKIKAEKGRPSKDVALSEEDQLLIRDEIKTLLNDLSKLGSVEGLETSQLIAISRNKTNLLENALKMQERAFNVKRLSEFQQVVMTVLEDLVSEEGRDIFLARIEPYRS